MSTIWVTGATGFLGRHVLKALAEAGHEAVPVVRQVQGWQAQDWRKEVGDPRPLEAPLNREALRAAVRGPPSAILHLAAEVRHSRRDAEAQIRGNVETTREVARFAEEAGARMVFVSTSGVAGCFAWPDQEADEDAPYARALVERWPYYRSKILCEELLLDRRARGGLDLVILRPPVLLGPGDHRRRASRHVQRILDGQGQLRLSGGMHFADVREVARATVTAATLPAARPVYHLPGMACPLQRFFEMVEEVAGLKVSRSRLPPRLLHPVSRVLYRAGVEHVLPDPVLVEMARCWWGLRSLHAQELGYRPRPGHQVLADTVDWLRRNPLPMARAA